MAKNQKKSDNCFDEFDDVSPKRKDSSIQVLYDYEKHYMELLREYSPEITMVVGMLSDFRKEQEQFYKETLPQIVAKLNQDAGIDDGMRKVWLKRLTMNMDRSFFLTENLINGYTTKKLDEFKTTINEKLGKL